ncbi:probable G-protein coupled receptor No18 [Limulus polyphemus]|uniref:Probable G-protein coupled receptor No18 n=1 Tax=Limulus polyphemus TaxID=6850 RepID=A0ABM1TI09_LIMPO|nr:probable G-protein coupled receptor No18 [Limulus polyphemus]XP_022255511.1 probable G-protein coupled receptor No18 [Limulus polyphemus]XP_022255512.1 probable G-protein coupled receptor No18 [Limulus polyphemus]XP_022255513.1 probable G-protein coupled receptor No18 [Limulus polyphemus]XP_022255514.1 probable G-protein coupled receptor No18 [Limulus polyphemus]XP_022255515.1 probable G-protein coupled receptor No18 [Limulus polyphemus]
MLPSFSGSIFPFLPTYDPRDRSPPGNSAGIPNFTEMSDGNNILTGDSVSVGEWAVRILGACVCIMLITMTLVGNVLVIVVVARFQRLRSVTNLLLASLASADITVALFVMPLLVLYDLERKWRFGAIACHLWISCDVMCCTASILHLCMIALDRFWAVTRPFRYQMLVSKKRILIAVLCIWICSGAISFIPIFLGWYDDSDGTSSIFQESNECSLEVNRVYAIISSMTSFYLPLPVMFYVYFRILLIAERQAREIKHLEVSLQTEDQHVKRSLRRRSRQLITDTKAIRTLGIIMGVFCVCWLPFFLMYVILAYCKQCDLSYEWRSALTWLGYLNSSFNPCIYVFLNKEFKEAFIRVLGCRYHSDSSEYTVPDDISSVNRHPQRMERVHITHAPDEENGRVSSSRHRHLDKGSPSSSRKTSISTFATDKSPSVGRERTDTNSVRRTSNIITEHETHNTLTTAKKPGEYNENIINTKEHDFSSNKPLSELHNAIITLTDVPGCNTTKTIAQPSAYKELIFVTELQDHNFIPKLKERKTLTI